MNGQTYIELIICVNKYGDYNGLLSGTVYFLLKRNGKVRIMFGGKKIIYFMDFPFCIGGSNKILLTQAYIMKQKGFQVKVVIPNDGTGQYTQEYDRICDDYALEKMSAHYSISVCLEEIDIMTALDEYKTIIKILDEYKPELIHSTQLNIAVEIAARELNIPHLMNIYQADEQAFNMNWMRVYPQYHSVDSIFMSIRWGEGLKIPSRCIRTAYSSNKSRACRKHDKNAEINILLMGILCERKNQLECIKLVAKCRKSGYAVKLTILGYDENEYGNMCKKYVLVNGLKNNVEFLGYVSNIEDYFERADLLILASKVESYPGVIVESMANKVPVIATLVAGVSELLENEKNAFLAEGYKSEDLYKAFLKYLEFQETGQITQLIENAYSTYLNNHSYDIVGNELEKYYQWIIKDYENRSTNYINAYEIKKKMNEFIIKRGIDQDQILIKKIWFFYHVISVIEQKYDKKAMIWGAGFWGKVTYEWLNILSKKIEFIGFIDSFKDGEYLGFPVVKGKNLLMDTCGTIIVSISDEKNRLEIMQYLDKKGKERNKDYFLIWNGPIRL